jgi:hypothetical protein
MGWVMGHVWGRGEFHAGFWWVRNQWEYLGMDERIILI